MSPSTPRFDVAIYMPLAAGHYRRSGPVGGGAELQTVLLARALAARGVRVAHIVFPVEDLAPAIPPSPSLIERAPDRGDVPLIGSAAEAVNIWRSMADADAAVYLFRTGRSRLLVGAMFCQAHRRKLVFAGANDLDFAFDEERSIHSPTRGYRAALRRTDAIVAQTEHQLGLVRQGLGKDHRATRIPSFVEPSAPATREPDGFIWIGRLMPYKQPLEYVRLAEALPDRRFRMVFEEGEDDPEEDRAVSRRMVAELRSAARRLPNLELIGQVRRDRVLHLIERSFAVVSTSTHEGMPNVFLEAWARGSGAVFSMRPRRTDQGASRRPHGRRLSSRAGPDRRPGLARPVATPAAWRKRPPLREPGARPRGGGQPVDDAVRRAAGVVGESAGGPRCATDAG